MGGADAAHLEHHALEAAPLCLPEVLITPHHTLQHTAQHAQHEPQHSTACTRQRCMTGQKDKQSMHHGMRKVHCTPPDSVCRSTTNAGLSSTPSTQQDRLPTHLALVALLQYTFMPSTTELWAACNTQFSKMDLHAYIHPTPGATGCLSGCLCISVQLSTLNAPCACRAAASG